MAPQIYQGSMWEKKQGMTHLAIIQMSRLRSQEERRQLKALETVRISSLSRLADWSKMH